MLQQTQAERVVAPYEAFLSRFPTPAACAGVAAAEVVRMWSGLGYNRRALNLHRTATAMVAEHDGAVPSDEKALRALPGVGRYTARAVLSFGFGVDVAAVDTNGVRVLSRCVRGAPLGVGEAETLGDMLVPPGLSWEFNQTMFDLGATVCTGRSPGCAHCPLREQCEWARAGLPAPDPWRASPSVRSQSAFAGSDRQGRGRLVHALRNAAVRADQVPAACGWPDDPARSERIAAALVAEGFARWSSGSPPVLRLR